MSWESVLALGGAALVLATLVVRPTWGLFALVVYYPFIELVPRFGPGVNAETALFVTGFLRVMLGGRRSLPPLRIVAPIATYVAMMLVSLAVLGSWYEPGPSERPLFDFALKLKWSVWPVVVFFIAYGIAADPATRRRGLVCLHLAALILCLAGIVDTGVSPLLGTNLRERATGLIGTPNALGVIAAGFSIVPLHRMFISGTAIPYRILHAISYCVMFLALLLTQSRRAWVAMVLGHLVWLWLRNRKLVLPALAAVALTVTAGYPLLPELVRQRIEQTFSPGQVVYQTDLARRVDPSAGERLVMYKIGGQMLLDSPIVGHGYESFRLLGPKYSARYGVLRGYDPHSLPLKVATETGFVGLIILGWMAAVVARCSLRLLRASGSDRDLGICFLGFVAILSIVSFVGTFVNNHYVAASFWIFFGLVVRAGVALEETAEDPADESE
jgi:O-antigen ligase